MVRVAYPCLSSDPADLEPASSGRESPSRHEKYVERLSHGHRVPQRIGLIELQWSDGDLVALIGGMRPAWWSGRAGGWQFARLPSCCVDAVGAEGGGPAQPG
jgi:hypothetical protein